VLFLQNKGFRYIEALVATLIGAIGLCFALELFWSRPSVTGMLIGFVPQSEIIHNPGMLYVAIGIVGATVMPHNLYLHSSIVQTRRVSPTVSGKREAIRFGTIDSTTALMLALFINAAILAVAAAAFHFSGHTDVADIQGAYKLLAPLLGAGAASVVFALALLASGQNSTLTGTLAGQIVMEGFLHLRLKPWLRRVITRALAVVPAVAIIGWYGESKTTELLVGSQVVLSLQLGFAVWPLLRFTNSRAKMGEFANATWLKTLGWLTTAIIIVLNLKFLFDTFAPDAMQSAVYRALGLQVPAS
jgi:manganese transport protein